MLPSSPASLGTLLQSKRLALRPADVGLPQVSARRTVGLRREEVAVLSGVSQRWLAALEQDKLTLKRFDALKRVLHTLRFSPAEQEQLLRQAGWRATATAAAPKAEQLASVQAVLDGMKYPAYAIDPLWERLCWNQAAAGLFSHWLGEQSRYANLWDYLLFDPHSRVFVHRWSRVVAQWVNVFRHDVATHSEPARVAAFVAHKCENSPIFARYWATPAPGSDHLAARYQFKHPHKGQKTYQPVTLALPESLPGTLVVWLPEKKPLDKA